MKDLDPWLAALGDGADYSADAADRLAARLAAEPSPCTIARRRGWAASAACMALACLSGVGVGAYLEAQDAPPTLASLLPAAAVATPTALLFGEEG